jgi:glucose/mannose transport system substrate-binding protein
MTKTLIVAAVAAAFTLPAAAQQSVEVLHWWTSGGEAAALNVLKGNLEKQGVKWNDMPVAGGGGEAAMTAVRARVTSGNPPTAVQMLGFDILDWGKQGVVADLNALAAKDGWDKVVPPRCRSSPSTTASGSPRRSTSTRPTGSGPTRRCWPRPA